MIFLKEFWSFSKLALKQFVFEDSCCFKTVIYHSFTNKTLKQNKYELPLPENIDIKILILIITMSFAIKMLISNYIRRFFNYTSIFKINKIYLNIYTR
jgi:hypothetical protein